MRVSFPNPTKELTVKFPIDKIQAAIKHIPEAIHSARLTTANDLLNFYQYTVQPKDIGRGTFLDVTLVELSPGETKISLEGKRRVGAIDAEWEAEETQKLLTDFIDLLSKALEGKLQARPRPAPRKGLGATAVILIVVGVVALAILCLNLFSGNNRPSSINRMESVEKEMKSANKFYQASIDRDVKLIASYGPDTSGLFKARAGELAIQAKYKAEMDALSHEMDSLSNIKP